MLLSNQNLVLNPENGVKWIDKNKQNQTSLWLQTFFSTSKSTKKRSTCRTWRRPVRKVGEWCRWQFYREQQASSAKWRRFQPWKSRVQMSAHHRIEATDSLEPDKQSYTQLDICIQLHNRQWLYQSYFWYKDNFCRISYNLITENNYLYFKNSYFAPLLWMIMVIAKYF